MTVLAVACCLAVEKGMAIRSRGSLGLTNTRFRLASRAAFGGAVIAVAVVGAKALGPSLGGIFATFPAMFVSTLAITYRLPVIAGTATR